ncbi:helix-turn-helix domain-containing protein [Tabrizicola oligotrophica]|uniref:Helix-turn-helix domain-containing protein n=1 Tax=Tabrizicola oligotrophica TaxID=2710650 RepID=A0A6M0QYF0_9RHOB|nr:helix-turn-helix domain-containing protein [Tabrizicola oligotrophica]NEY91843.1 helix-turn-helix domain-containing protein [Tabrizicola oligotrophica]
MSHRATIWAIQQRGLKPATKIVLWFLCDRHNPDFGCFPTQARLAEDAEMSISSLNEHLARLQELRLIHRVRTHDPRTHKRQATRYILGFEEGFPQEPTPESGDGFDGTEEEQENDPSPESGYGNDPGAISGFSAKPSPDFAESHLRNPETNHVREPLSKPVKEEEGARACAAISDQVFGELLDALGLDPAALPGWWQGWPPRLHVQRWHDELGLTEAEIVAVAEASRQDHPEPPDGPKALDRAMQRAAQRKVEDTGRNRRKPKAPPTPAAPPITDLPAFYAELVNGDRYLPVSAISNTMRDAMLARGLVTEDRLRERGIR